MEPINDFFSLMSSFLWGWPMIILLLGTHVFLTFRLRIPQRKLLTGIRLSIKKDSQAKGDVSQFGALATALAATIGTGNIVGVATAVALGGPGAVLWCWLTGIFGMSTKYAEALLAVKYRVKSKDGCMYGGPMYALERGLGMRWLGIHVWHSHMDCGHLCLCTDSIGGSWRRQGDSQGLHVPRSLYGCVLCPGLYCHPLY